MVLVAAILVVIAGAYITISIGDSLRNNRLQTALYDSARTTVAAQQRLDISETNDRTSLSNLMLTVRNTVRETTASQLIYIRRQPGQPVSLDAPLDFRTGAGVMEAVSPELSKQLRTGGAPQYWQYTELQAASRLNEQEIVPGVIVATTIVFPGSAGIYEMYIAYSFAETEKSLQLISVTLMTTAIILVLFFALFTWFAITKMFKPVRSAASVSRQLASGQRDARMRHQNDSYFDELADNFNDMANTLSARITELDTLSTMQQQFVSDVSHELRTPLTTIRLASEVLSSSSSSLKPAQQKAIEVLNYQVSRFEALLNDLLEISRYDAGRVQLETEATSLVDLISEIIDDLQPLSNSIIELRPLGGYDKVDVDPRRIRRILRNLIENAIEHGESRPIIVTINANTTAIAVTVRDYGIGMAQAQTERVFDRFWRADPSRKRTLGGTGLGLAIAQEDAAVHGGVIDVWSESGVGTVFRLTIPLSATGDSFLSPLPLVPEDITGFAEISGWIDRPRRWLMERDEQ